MNETKNHNPPCKLNGRFLRDILVTCIMTVMWYFGQCEMYYDIIIIYIYIFVIYCYHALAYENEMLNSNNSQQYNQR
jgi:Ca2+/Na+ antiporter